LHRFVCIVDVTMKADRLLPPRDVHASGACRGALALAGGVVYNSRM
jgi:hypothetical protein